MNKHTECDADIFVELYVQLVLNQYCEDYLKYKINNEKLKFQVSDSEINGQAVKYSTI